MVKECRKDLLASDSKRVVELPLIFEKKKNFAVRVCLFVFTQLLSTTRDSLVGVVARVSDGQS